MTLVTRKTKSFETILTGLNHIIDDFSNQIFEAGSVFGRLPWVPYVVGDIQRKSEHQTLQGENRVARTITKKKKEVFKKKNMYVCIYLFMCLFYLDVESMAI